MYFVTHLLWANDNITSYGDSVIVTPIHLSKRRDFIYPRRIETNVAEQTK